MEDRKIGVYVCHCGTNIGGVVDVPKVVEFASGLDSVVSCPPLQVHVL